MRIWKKKQQNKTNDIMGMKLSDALGSLSTVKCEDIDIWQKEIGHGGSRNKLKFEKINKLWF